MWHIIWRTSYIFLHKRLTWISNIEHNDPPHMKFIHTGAGVGKKTNTGEIFPNCDKKYENNPKEIFSTSRFCIIIIYIEF